MENKKNESIIFTPHDDKMLLEAIVPKIKILMPDGSNAGIEYFLVISVGKNVKKYNEGQKIIASNIVPTLNPKFVIENYDEKEHGKRYYAIADTINDWQIEGFIK